MSDLTRQRAGGKTPKAPPTRALHALLLDGLADVILVTDGADTLVEANLAATNLLGYPRAELLRMRINAIAASEAAEAFLTHAADDGVWQSEVDFRHKDGSIVWTVARASQLETPEGRWRVLLVQQRSDTLAEARLGAIIESSYDAIFSWSTDGTIDSWNASAERLFGYRAEEIIGRPLSILAPPERSEEPQQKLARLLRGQRLRDFETIRLRKDGVRIEVSLSVSPVHDARGRIVGVAEIARDISVRRQADRRTKVLYQLSDALAGASSEGEIFQAAMDALQRAVAVDRISVLMADSDGVMRFRAWRGLSETYRRAVEGHDAVVDSAGSLGSLAPSHIPDVQADNDLGDARTRLLSEGIRAVTFLPLQQHGRLLGKVVLHFDTPWSLSEDQLELSITIAQQLVFAITRFETMMALEASRIRLDLITVGSADGITIQDEDGHVVYANLAAAKLSGYDSVEEFLSDTRSFFEHWDVFDEHGSPVEYEELPGRRALMGEPNPEALLRIRDRITGSEHWRRVRALAAAGGVSSTRFAINVFHDVTEERHTQDRLRLQAALLHAQSERSLQGILVVSPDARMMSWNQRYLDIWQPDEEILGTRSDHLVARLLAPTLKDPESFLQRIEQLYTDPFLDATDELELVDGRLIERTTTPLVDEVSGALQGRIWYYLDITMARRREAEQKMLSDASKILASSLDDESRFGAVLDALLEWAGDLAALYIADRERLRVMTIRCADDPLLLAHKDTFGSRFPILNNPGHPARRAILEGRPVFVDDVTDEVFWEESGGGPFLGWARATGLGAAVFVPIPSPGRPVGALSLAFSRSRRTDLSVVIPSLEELASRIALAFENARLYAERDHVARTLQEGLLPATLPDIPGLEIGTRYRAVGEGINVGGDFFDAFDMRDGWGIVIGDVCGKGPASAVFTTVARQSLRSIALLEDEPVRILAHVNQALMGQAVGGQFCTMALARIVRTADGAEVLLSGGGHPAPILVHPDGSTKEIELRGSLLGIFPDPELKQVQLRLQPGDSLVFYTDGVIDEHAASQAFGGRKLRRVLGKVARRPADSIAASIEEAVIRWSRSQPRDDIAIVVLRVLA